MNEEKSKSLDQVNASIKSSLFSHTHQLAEQTERLNQLVSTSRLDSAFSQIAKQSIEVNSEFTDIFNKIRETSRLISTSRLDSAFSQVARQSIEANRLSFASEFTDIFRKIKEVGQLISTSRLDSAFSQIARQSIEANRLSFASEFTDIKSQLAMTSSLVKVMKIESLAQFSLSRLRSEKIGESILTSNVIHASVFEKFNRFSSAYSSLVRSRDDISWRDLPEELMVEQPALEVLESTSFLESISDPTLDEQFEIEKNLSRDEVLEKTGGMEELLIEIDKDLVTMWRGAVEALESGHKDYARHCSVSLRELLTHVLHKLSPDDEIQQWDTDPSLFSNKKPTRRARLLFICRAVNNDLFSDFINKDIDATIEFFTLFQRGTHQISIPYTHKQLLTLKNKVESTISFLIQTHQLNFRD